jgi:hypothetical protein
MFAAAGLVVESASANPPTPDLNNWRGPCFNCYNYACNTRGAALNAYFAQPGVAGGAPFGALNCAGVQAAAVADGLMFLGNPAPGQPLPNAMGKCIVGLAVDPGGPGRRPDYHWYRFNQNGQWSDKPGQTPAKIFGNGAVPPHNAAAQRGRYTQFCGYFGVDSTMPPNIQGRVGAWRRAGIGGRAYSLTMSGPDDGPQTDLSTVVAFQSHTPLGTSLLVPPAEPDMAFNDSVGCSLVLDDSAHISGFTGMTDPRYFRAFNSGGIDYVAAYASLEPVSTSDIQYYLDDRGFGMYLCSVVPAPGAAGLLMAAGVLSMARRRR